MKFELKIHPSINCSGTEVRELIEKKLLYVTRDEIISTYEEDDVDYYVTLREMLYMYHSIHGFFTQVSDGTMYDMYETLKNDESLKGIEYLVSECEQVSLDSDYARGHSFSIDMRYV